VTGTTFLEADEMGWLSNLFGGGESDGGSDDEAEAREGSAADAGEDVEQVDLEGPEAPWATVLYPFPVELDRARLEELLEEAEVDWEEIEVGHSGRFRIVLEAAPVVLEARDEPFPDGRMNRRLLPETFPDDYAHVAVEPQVDDDPLERRNELREPGAHPDPWGDSGVMRELTRIVRGLLGLDGTAVVLNRSRQLAVPAQQFMEFTAGVDEGDWSAVMGWLDVEPGGDGEPLRTEGLALFGLPELTVHYEHGGSGWGLQRRLEAMRAAVGRMIVENRALGADPESEACLGLEPLEEFRVQLGGDFDPDDPPGEQDDVVAYRIEPEEGRLEMQAIDRGTVWETWGAIDQEGAEIERSAYQALFRYMCDEPLGAPVAGVGIDEIEGMEGIGADIYQADESAPVHFVTNGLGRRPRSFGDGDSESVRVELAIRSAEPFDQLVDVLTNCAAGFELADKQWGPADVLEFEEPLYNMQAFLLAPLFDAEPEKGPTVEVWQLVPLTEDEHDRLADGGGKDWLEKHDYATGPEFAERWSAVRG
jgi:hypothetical protein